MCLEKVEEHSADQKSQERESEISEPKDRDISANASFLTRDIKVYCNISRELAECIEASTAEKYIGSDI